jgi:hypothetical protein
MATARRTPTAPPDNFAQGASARRCSSSAGHARVPRNA